MRLETYDANVCCLWRAGVPAVEELNSPGPAQHVARRAKDLDRWRWRRRQLQAKPAPAIASELRLQIVVLRIAPAAGEELRLPASAAGVVQFETPNGSSSDVPAIRDVLSKPRRRLQVTTMHADRRVVINTHEIVFKAFVGDGSTSHHAVAFSESQGMTDLVNESSIHIVFGRVSAAIERHESSECRGRKRS